MVLLHGLPTPWWQPQANVSVMQCPLSDQEITVYCLAACWVKSQVSTHHRAPSPFCLAKQNSVERKKSNSYILLFLQEWPRQPLQFHTRFMWQEPREKWDVDLLCADRQARLQLLDVTKVMKQFWKSGLIFFYLWESWHAFLTITPEPVPVNKPLSSAFWNRCTPTLQIVLFDITALVLNGGALINFSKSFTRFPQNWTVLSEIR